MSTPDVMPTLVDRKAVPTLGTGSPMPDRRVIGAVVACLLLTFLGGDRSVYWLRPQLDLVLVAAIFWMLRDRLVTARLGVLPVLLVAWCCASYVWSVDRLATEREIVYSLPIFVTALVVGSLLTAEQLIVAIRRAIEITILLTLLYIAVYRAAAWAPALDGAPGFRGPFSHKNSAGMFFAIASLFAVDQLRSWRGRAVMVASLTFVVLSRSSTALVLTIVGVLGVAYVWRLLGRSRPGRRATNAVLAVIALFVVPVTIARFLGDATALVGRDATLTGRVDVWRAVLRPIRTHLLSGVGYGGPWLNLTPFSQSLFRDIGFRAYHAHNAYLDWLLQIGLIGLLLLLGIVMVTMTRLGSAATNGSRPAVVLFVLLALMLAGAVAESSPLLGEGFVLLGLMWGTASNRSDSAFASASLSQRHDGSRNRT